MASKKRIYFKRRQAYCRCARIRDSGKRTDVLHKRDARVEDSKGVLERSLELKRHTKSISNSWSFTDNKSFHIQ